MDQLPPQMVMYQLATAFYASQALGVAANLGVADHLPATAGELADKLGLHAGALRRVLRLLVSTGVFVERDDGRFDATPLGALLRTGPGSMRSMVRLFAGPGQWATWGDLVNTVRTGEPALQRVFRTAGPFEYFEGRPEEAKIFDEAMSAFTAMTAVSVAAAYDWSAVRSVCDVGGGDGAMIAGLLRAHPGLRGACFDLPRTGEPARARIRDTGLADRCEFVGGDFFAAVPAGHDVYVMKHVIHDWDDAHAAKILANVRAALGTGGRLLVVEGIYPDRIDTGLASRGAAGNDCNMLVATGGLQRTEREFRELFAAAGLRLARVIPTQGPPILEVVPT
ncbi:MAG: methyltransferase [Deltaproteobacteria bacterium]|nr:methyltransferase [Deltaproteobacteria bacterium]